MNHRTKKLIGEITAVILSMSAVQLIALAANEPFEMDFSNESDTLSLSNPNDFLDYTYSGERVEGAAGKDAGDFAFESKLKDVPYTLQKNMGAVIPFYDWTTYTDAGSDVLTMELSLKYNEGCDRVLVSTYSSTNPNNWNLWLVQTDWVKFENGRIYVVETTGDGITKSFTDTGMEATPGEWYRIVVEAAKNEADSSVYINGKQFKTNLSGSFLGHRWTQVNGVLLKDSSKEKTRDVSVTIDDVKTYTGAYNVTGNETVEYTVDSTYYNADENKYSVNAGMGLTVKDILDTITTNNDKYIINSLSGNDIVDNDSKVEDGNVVVIRSSDGGTYEYIDITVEKYEPGYIGNVERINGEGDEAADVGFYGRITGQYADENFGIRVTLPNADGEGNAGTHDFEYSGSIVGDVVFGIILRGLSDEQLDGITAEYIQ